MLTESMLTESTLTESTLTESTPIESIMLITLTTPLRAKPVRYLGMTPQNHAVRRSLWGKPLVGTIRSSRLELGFFRARR